MDAEPARIADPEVVRSGGRPAEQLAMLLSRADCGALDAGHVAGVRHALMHYCGLQSCRHTKGPPRPMDRRTYRHSFLLPDGSVRVLWELEHTTDPDGRARHAAFADQEDLAVAEWDVDAAFGAPNGPVEPPAPPQPRRAAAPGGPAPAGPADAADGPGEGDEPPADGCGVRRAYTEGDSPEHAWRLLRRAANPGAPGQDMLSRLGAAIAHDITIVTRRSALVCGRLVSWALYEHAFLLLDGSEVSLWEIDHTRTPSGTPVCEVFASRDAALDTAVRRIESN